MSSAKLTVCAVSAAMLLSLGGCGYKSGSEITFHASGLPHHEHPHQDWWTYQFIYHPHDQVYFEPYTRTFFWCEDDQWMEGSRLPSSFNINPDYARVVYIKTPYPHAQHLTVVASAGPAYDVHEQSPWPGENGPFTLTHAPTD